MLGAAVSVAYYLLTRDNANAGDRAEEVIRVEIYNGSGQAGVARRAKAYLREKGYDVLSIGNAREHFDQTVVVERRSSSNANARMLARTLRLNEKVVTQFLDSSSPVAVTLIIGDDYVNYLPDSVEMIQ